MGLKLRDIVISREISLQELSGHKLVVDAHNTLYQFLSSIRTMDGSLLTDSKGNVTSHLTGLFSRSANLMQAGLKLAFVFDGKPPALKRKESERRRAVKEEARREYEIAKERQDIESMKKHASRAIFLTPPMIEEAKRLITALGMPVVQAPSEGEAQAASIVSAGHAFAEVSQDYDCLMFGVPKLVRNLTITERKKMPGRLSYEVVKPELLDLAQNLLHWGVSREQLIALGILMGTDYNPGGIRGIGPKKALTLVKQHGTDFEALFKAAGWDEGSSGSWKEIYETIHGMPVTSDYNLEWRQPDREAVIALLCGEHDFAEKRVTDTLDKISKQKQEQSQKGLGAFF